ncbi:MAG: peptidylprolyl isomerase [Gemmatimonadales bacterium]
MTRIRFRATALLAMLALSACSGLRDALTAHVDIAARAGSQELSVTQLAQMMSAAKVPARKDVGLAIANLWVNYSLLGQASSKGDTLGDPKAVDDGMWMQIAQAKEKKFYDAIQKTFPAPDSTTFERHFNDGDLLAARHILLMGDRNTLKPAQIDSVRKAADKVLKQVTAANFSDMAKKYSQDPGSKASGGEYVFPKGKMVPEFEKATLSLKPGEISGLVQTQYGFHIIKRETWPEAKDKFSEEYRKSFTQSAESTYLVGMETKAAVAVKPGAARTVKAVAADIDAYRDDKTVIASSHGPELTAARLARWIAAIPPQQRVREGIAQAPDSVLPNFVKNLMRQELMIHAADSAKVTLDSQDINGIRRAFTGSVMNSMSTLSIAPSQLKDSAKTASDRERLAQTRVDAYLGKLLRNEAQFAEVSEPVTIVLRKKYEARVVTAGVDRAVAEATKLTAAADSAKAKALPSSVVPTPGQPAPGAAAAPGPGAAGDAKKAAPTKQP